MFSTWKNIEDPTLRIARRSRESRYTYAGECLSFQFGLKSIQQKRRPQRPRRRRMRMTWTYRPSTLSWAGLLPVSPLVATMHDAEDQPSVPAPNSNTCEPCDPEEDTEVRWLKEPVKPSPAEIAQHNVLHIPLRSWCKYCVRGRGKSI